VGRAVAMHQPNYIPYLGYFCKMKKCDCFVYLDAVQYPRGRSFAARNRIKTSTGVAFLTVPVSVPSGKEGKFRYSEIEFANDEWKSRHLKTIDRNYRRAAHFAEVFPLYEYALQNSPSLVELNIALIEAFSVYLGIAASRVRLSHVLNCFGRKNRLIIDICRALEADTYISGTGGGRDYNDEELLASEGIRLEYAEFTAREYGQLWGEFVPNLSVVDALFNVGKRTTELL